ncbi:MAG: lysoplasmalogenase [Bacilli bacterium]|nr:lysoplasmalogenase [Bacilli bacterium]
MKCVNLLFFIAICIGNYFYITVGGLLIKSITSALFASLGFINMVYALKQNKKYKKFYLAMSIGLILAMLGDIFLEIEFILGAALFAMGHIGFLIAYCFSQKIRGLDVIISLVFFACVAVFMLYSPIVVFDDPIMKWVCLIYAFVISLMLGKALGNFIKKKDNVTGTIALGSILFTISDFMLLLSLFVELWSWTGEVCLATYYPAEFLLAYSIYARANKK